MTIALPKFGIIDRPSTWSVHLSPAPYFNVEDYQAKLDRIADVTQSGEPVLKLCWGGNESWLENVDGIWTERPRFAIRSLRPETFGQPTPIRRWIIAENTDPGQLDQMGGKNHGNIQAKEQGFYRAWIFIGNHTKCPPQCGNAETGKTCYGDYKEPGSAELDYITECTYDLFKDKNRPDPRKAIVAEHAVPYLPQVNEEELEALAEEENLAVVKDFLGTHGVGRTQNTKPQ